MTTVDILLSTFNGEKYIANQIESLISLDHLDWQLLIRDDGSADSTPDLIKEYSTKYPDKIKILDSDNSNQGPGNSFLLLMKNSTASYITFCDQDDIWEHSKLTRQLKEMRNAENKYGASCPILVHSDMSVVNENLSILSASFWKYQKLDPKKMATLKRLLVQNCVTGCTVLVNKKLLELALLINNPENIIMHDWWLAIIAAAKGKIISMQQPMVKYRQHSGNEIGANKWGTPHKKDIIIEGFAELKKRILATKVQAEELLRTGVLDPEEEKVVRAYIDAFDLNWFKRRIQLFSNGYIKYGLERNLGMFLAL